MAQQWLAILLQSYGGLDIDLIPWPQKSWTKRKVASQPAPDQQMLPPEILELPMAMDVLADLSAQPSSDRVIVTLVEAYAIDAVTGESAFYIGHPRLNHRGGEAWHWRVLLDTDGHNGIGRGLPTSTPAIHPSIRWKMRLFGYVDRPRRRLTLKVANEPAIWATECSRRR